MYGSLTANCDDELQKRQIAAGSTSRVALGYLLVDEHDEEMEFHERMMMLLHTGRH